MTFFGGFDAYCEEHGVQPGEEPAAFAAYLNQTTGWDGPMAEVQACVACQNWDESVVPRPVNKTTDALLCATCGDNDEVLRTLEAGG